MAALTSAGLLLYRHREGRLEVLLIHPGGPYWARRDEGAWSIPKGTPEPGEDLITTARREFAEETGFAAPGPAIPLGSIRQKAGKVVHAWAVEGDADPAALSSNTFEMEWPPRSGRRQVFPEVDRCAWLDLDAARAKMLPAQAAFLDRLSDALEGSGAR
ncbi:MAG: NUDIX domain-containing protein [Vicinamibacterales bacterium]